MGIGASAGGLAALKGLFEALPNDTGAAFVVIQHLDPKHESLTAEILTAEILTRSTTMPAVQVVDGMTVQANHVYVIPPNTYLTLDDHSFKLNKPVLHHGLRMPIDTFLWSLAEQHEDRAIAIIVSGTGSDGTLGIRAINGSGGLVLAQSPDSADYEGMPSSAIATGLVDFTCPVQEMPAHIKYYLQHPYIIKQTNTKRDGDIPKDEKSQLSAILAFLKNRVGHDFRAYKLGTLGRRIARRMEFHHLKTMTAYLSFLRKNEDEANLLFKDLLISVTAFFRDPEAFSAFEQKVIIPLVASKHDDQPIRVWIPGCATGEEAYSIAMLLVEHLEKTNTHCSIQIFASDIDETALSYGRTGLYPENIESSVSEARLQRFFSKEDHSYRIKKSLRKLVTFASQNLISDPPFSNLDLISCRNLLIYLSAEVQSKVLALFHFALRENGNLFLGHSETSSQQESLFKPLAKKWRIYQRTGPARSTSRVEFPIASRITRSIPPFVGKQVYDKNQLRLGDVTQQFLLQEFAPAAVLVNIKHQIVHFSGPTSRYLEQPSGSPSQDLLVLAKHELRAKLRLALRQVTEENKRVVIDDIQMLKENGHLGVKVVLRPINVPHNNEPMILITFEEQDETDVTPKQHKDQQLLQQQGSRSTNDSSLIEQMEAELQITREMLQTNVEEWESANEELQAANEEVMSANEELQSSNEELESSKEELQSMNEELTTVNNQYKDKVEELAKSNDDLDNFLSSTNIATLFVDNNLRIGRFTPATQELLNLISTDIGRPIIDIRPKFLDHGLMDDIKRVLSNLVPVECEIKTENGSYYLRRILPYRTNDYRIAGVVITFIDISQRKRSEEDTLRLATIIRDSNDAFTLCDLDGKITAWNNGAQRMYGWSEQQALGMNLLDLIPMDEQKNAKQLMQSIIKGEHIQSAEAKRIGKDGRKINVLLTLTPLLDQAGVVIAIASTEKDISRRINAENELRASDRNFRSLVESAPDALVIVNASGKIEVANSQAEKLFGYSKQELIGMLIEQLMPSRFAEKHVQHRKSFFTQPKFSVVGNGIKLFALTKSGEEIPVEVGLSPIETDHGKVVSAAIRDIRQRQRSDEALQLAKTTAESALAAKSRFLATASHDLRQPLHSLTLLNKALFKSIDKPEAKKMLGMQGDSLFAMARLLNSLLDISKLESGTVAAQPSHFALRPMLEKLCAGFEVEAYEKGIGLTLEANDNHVVYSDPGLLNQLLQNLLANAIRYTKVGKVTIASSQKHNIVKVSISDTGIGIPAEQLIYIFDEFHQVNRNPQQHHGGLGLGLSIVQRIADLLGTQVNVTSKVGRGSTFSISLPLGKPTLATVSKKETNTHRTIEKNVQILLVDDDPDVLEASEMLLSMEEGFNIVSVSSPTEAYAQMDKQLPDLIITDFHLNHKESGLDIIHKAKTKEGQQIPAILVSGDTSAEMETISGENLQLMTKPLNPDELISQAYRLLAQAK